MWQRHHQHRLRVRNEGQTRTALHDLVDRHVQIVRHKSQHREDSKPGEYRCENVRCRHDQRIVVDIVVELCRRFQ